MLPVCCDDEAWGECLPGRYSVSTCGRVRNDQSGRLRVFGWAGKPGRKYADVDWQTNGQRIHRRVHHLVLETFVGSRPKGLNALHDDDDRRNNHVSNLRWGTHSENMQDRAKNGNNPSLNKTHCGVCGGPYSGDNLIFTKTGRDCLACRRRRNKRGTARWRAKQDLEVLRAKNREATARYRERLRASDKSVV